MYKYNLHTHTSEVSPCGHVSAEILVNMHKEAGYQGVIITDHFWPGFVNPKRGNPWQETYKIFKSGFEAAKKQGEIVGLDVFFGMELRFEENFNDYLVFGLPDEFVLLNQNLTLMSLKEFREKTKDLDVLIIQAHPFRKWIKVMPAELLDGVEIFNASMRHDSRNQLAADYANTHNLIGVSGSDFHELEDINRGEMRTKHRIIDMKDFIKTLRARNFTAITQIAD